MVAGLSELSSSEWSAVWTSVRWVVAEHVHHRGSTVAWSGVVDQHGVEDDPGRGHALLPTLKQQLVLVDISI